VKATSGQDQSVAVAILAGGASRRMGQDKALLPIDGIPCLQRVIRAATAWPTLVIGRERPRGWNDHGIRFEPDDYPGEGPLGGLLTAFRHHRGPVLVLPCDIPDVDAPTLRSVAQAWIVNQPPAMVCVLDGEINPLIALYSPLCHAICADAFATGERSPRRLLERLGAQQITLKHTQRLIDIDTPADLALRHARQNAYCV